MPSKALHRLVTGIAASLLVVLVLRAALTVDPYFDTVAYHLPFAARLAGLCPENCYRMDEYLESAYAGFPKLMHVLQGWVWKLSGHAQLVDLLNVGALALFCVFLRRFFQVPLAWTFCALLAVPLIQIHATSTYIDLPVNLAVATAILVLVALLRTPASFGWRPLVLVIACLAFAANSKPQMIGVALPLLALLGLIALILLVRGRRVGPFDAARRIDRFGLLAVLVAGGVLIAAKFIDNALTQGNPFYPIQVEIFGFVLEGPIAAMQIGEDSLATIWLSVPSPLRWLASVLEIGAYAFRQLPWTFDQGYCVDVMAWKDCGRAVGPSFRMGGYFVPYVLALIAFLFWALAARVARDRRILIAVFIGTTVLAACLPRSHELRYYMFWVIVLIGLCLIAVFDRADQPPRPQGSGLFAGIVLLAFLSVLCVTQGRYVNPLGFDLADVMEARGISQQVAAIPQGAVVCVDPGWQPFTALFAPVYHPGRAYSVLDGPIGACTVSVPPPPEE